MLVLGPQADRSKISDYIVTLDSLAVSSGTTVKDLGVIVDSSLSFEAQEDMTTIAFSHLTNTAKIRNVMSLHDAELFKVHSIGFQSNFTLTLKFY